MFKQKMMEYFFESEKLQSVFLTILADFVTPPTQFIGLGVPFINPEPSFDENMPLKLSDTCEHSSYRYILGGMGSIVKTMADLIKKGGGKFQINKAVKKIVTELLGYLEKISPTDKETKSQKTKDIFDNIVDMKVENVDAIVDKLDKIE